MAIPKRFRDTIRGSGGALRAAEKTENKTQTEAETEPESKAKTETKTQAKPETTQLYMSPGTDGSLTLYTEEAFKRIADQLDRMPSTGKEVRAFSRLFFSRSEHVEIDKQGRIRIPANLAEMAEIVPGEAMLIGVRDRMEIWNTARWQKYIEGTETNYDALAEEVLKRKD